MKLVKDNQQAFIIQPVEPVVEIKQPSFYNVPNSVASDLVLETLSAGDDLGALPERKKQVSHATSLTVQENGKRRQVALTNQRAQITIELADIDKLTGSNKAAKKLFVLCLIKANEQAIHGGQLTRDYVSFPLQELIDIGFYGRPQSARKGFNSGMDALTSIKIKGHIQQTAKKGSSIEALEVLFTGARIERGQCTVYFNTRINWGFMAQYFTILPRYYFRLSNRGSDLLYYIFYLARQNTKEIEQNGSFNISFRALQQRLKLPSEINNGNPYKTIKQPIETAIEELETEHNAMYGNTEFSLYPVYDDNASIVEYLDKGYLRIGLTGDFAKTFTEISTKTAKQIEEIQRKRQRITEKAIAANMAKNMEQDEKPN